MKQFLENLRAQATENPAAALGIGVALLATAAKFIEAAGNAVGSSAYARDVNRRVRRDQQ